MYIMYIITYLILYQLLFLYFYLLYTLSCEHEYRYRSWNIESCVTPVVEIILKGWSKIAFNTCLHTWACSVKHILSLQYEVENDLGNKEALLMLCILLVMYWNIFIFYFIFLFGSRCHVRYHEHLPAFFLYLCFVVGWFCDNNDNE